MKIKLILSGILVPFLISCTDHQIASTSEAIGKVLKESNSQVSTDEVSRGLKEALTQGISKGSEQAAQTDGYYKNALLKIYMPAEMQKVNSKLRSLGFNKLMDDFELSLNRGAEEAAKEAKPIFVNAIKSLTIQDAWNILKGQNDAATVYLKRTTNNQLYNAFKPIINQSLLKVNATKYYTDVITTYNRLPMVEKVNADLTDYVTNKAIDGLFILVKQEEANIRQNPAARVSAILKKVFTPQNMQK